MKYHWNLWPRVRAPIFNKANQSIWGLSFIFTNPPTNHNLIQEHLSLPTALLLTPHLAIWFSVVDPRKEVSAVVGSVGSGPECPGTNPYLPLLYFTKVGVESKMRKLVNIYPEGYWGLDERSSFTLSIMLDQQKWHNIGALFISWPLISSSFSFHSELFICPDYS